MIYLGEKVSILREFQWEPIICHRIILNCCFMRIHQVILVAGNLSQTMKMKEIKVTCNFLKNHWDILSSLQKSRNQGVFSGVRPPRGLIFQNSWPSLFSTPSFSIEKRNYIWSRYTWALLNRCVQRSGSKTQPIL